MTKKLTAALLAVFLLGSLCLTAFADEIPEVGLEQALKKAREFNEWKQQHTAEQIAAEKGISIWDVLSSYGTEVLPEPVIDVHEGESWDSLISRLLEKYGANRENVGIGYYNTRTGEERYVNADKYIVSASLFKVPLNMIFADRVSSGEMTMDTEIWGMPYRWYQNRTIVYSDNERSVNLMEYLGGYTAFKEKQIPYLGNDPSADLGWSYQIENFYNAREFIYLLRLLYEDPDRFPGILENMLEAEPYHYFRQYETRWPIAQKYGFVEQTENTGYHNYINTCGVVFTDDPFCLVVFTDNVSKAYDLISETCTVMCDYTNMISRMEDQLEQAREQERIAQEQADVAAAEALSQELAGRFSRLGGSGTLIRPVNTAEDESLGRTSRFHMSVISTIIVIWIMIVALAALVLIFRHNTAGKINAFWAVLAILLAALGLILCVVGLDLGTVVARPDGDPQETAQAFFEALLARDYPAAYACLSNYTSLGLENTPAEEDTRLIAEALKSSYGYTLLGRPTVENLQAKQRVAVLHLNLSKIRQEAVIRSGAILQELIAQRDRSLLYDADGHFLPTVSDEVYHKAIAEVLESGTAPKTSSEMELTLVYRDGKWLIEAGEELLAALSGGI